MPEITIKNVEPLKDAEIRESVDLAVNQAAQIEIANQEGLDKAATFLRGLKTILEGINDTFDRSIALAHKTHREILAAKNAHTNPLKRAEIIVKDAMGKYQMKQERILREAEERLRLEEQERQRKIREEEEARLAEAVKLEEEGKAAEAEAVLDSAPDEEVPAPLPVAPAPSKTKGVSMSSVWKWKIIELGAVPQEYWMLDEKMIDAAVRRMKGSTAISGIEVYETKQVSARPLR